MTLLSENNKIEFFKFLDGDKSLSDIEELIYLRKDLEQQLDAGIYLELIGFNFKDKVGKAKLTAFIRENIIDEGEYEAWKLKTILTNFLADPGNVHIYLDKLYHLYCGIYQENGQRKYEYKFLANLGLNYLYWMDEGYLKTNYGVNWQTQYQKYLADLEFYHQQLKPFAIEILTAINNSHIQILKDGTYKITRDLQRKLETDKIYQLKHVHKK